MGTRRTKLRKGGVAIASGTDGCVFDTQFDEAGKATSSTEVVSKVFPRDKQVIAENEFAANQLVKRATDGRGVLISTTLKTIRSVQDTIPDKVARRGDAPNACGRVVDQTEGYFYVIESPRVKGSLVDEKSRDLPIAFFTDAIDALQKLSAVGLCHMDIASRNIFVSNDARAIVGDFGNLIDINAPDLKATLAAHLKKYKINSVNECLASDGTTAALQIAIFVYMTSDFNGIKAQINHLLKPYALGRYEFMDLYFEAGELKGISGLDLNGEMKSYLESILALDSPDDALDILKKEIARSDLRCLTIVMRNRCAASVELDMTLESLWKSGTLPIRTTTLSLAERLARLKRGGRRKTRRKRHMRVKMSRRR
jgi:hypothetical protein